MIDEETIRRQYEMLRPALDERARRLFAASHVQMLGRGGIAAVARATGIAPSTIWTGTEGTRSGGGGGPAAPAAGRRSQAVGRHQSLARERPPEPDRAGDFGGSGATAAVGLEEFGKAGGGVARDGASGLRRHGRPPAAPSWLQSPG